MKKWVAVGVGLFTFLLTLPNVSLLSQQEKQPAEDQPATKPASLLPAGLAAFYPPLAKEPLFLFKMIELAHAFSGTLSDFLENDLENSRANFDKFKARYGDLSGLILEWKDKYPYGPVKELDAALITGDQGKVIAAFEKVGGVCSGCHINTMAKVQYKYGWPDFSAVRAKDPLTGEDIDLHRLMVYLDTSFTGIGADIAQAQAENARKQYQGFRARFDTMAGTCEDCHGPNERKYYVDNGIRSIIEELGKTIAESAVEKEKVEKLVMGIGMESCHKCHLVHIPAAFAQRHLK